MRKYLGCIEMNDEHFFTKLDECLDRLQVPSSSSIDITLQPPFYTDSPLTLSNSNSDVDENDSASVSSFVGKRKSAKPSWTYDDVERALDKYYIQENAFCSSPVIFMTTYLQSMKRIHEKSGDWIKRKNFALFLCGITVGIFSTILPPFLQNIPWGAGILSLLHLWFTLLFVHFYRNHHVSHHPHIFYQTAIHYGILAKHIEHNMYNAKQLLCGMEEWLRDLETSFSCPFPEWIQQNYPLLCHLSVIPFLQKMEWNKKHRITQLCDIKNEISAILRYKQRLLILGHRTDRIDECENRLAHLEPMKARIKEECIYYKSVYGEMERLFLSEIQNTPLTPFGWNGFFGKKKEVFCSCDHPVVCAYLQTIFGDSIRFSSTKVPYE